MKVRRLDRRTRVEWLLDYYRDGKRVRRWFQSRTEAEAEAATIKEQKVRYGDAWVNLDPGDRADMIYVFNEARKDGISLRTVWEAYKSGKLDAAPMQRRTLGEAIKETVAAKRTENLRERYIEGLEAYLNRFALGRREMFIDKVGVADIEQWFDQRNEALSTRRGNLGRLGSMFDVAFRRGYIKDNPILRIAAPRIDQKAPERFSPEEARTLLRHASKRKTSLAYFVLALFAGIRPEELLALKWSSVDLDAGHVVIDAEASKVRRRRIVPLHKTAITWLRPLKAAPDKMIAPPCVTLRRHRRALREVLGRWPQDVLRHSAASYLIALHQDAGRVALWLGNSIRILEQNYKDPVSPSDCDTFWSLTPNRVK